MTRKEESRTISIVESAKQDGYDIRINYSVDGIGKKPTSVNSSGSKVEGESTLSFNISTSVSGGPNVQFSAETPWDAALATTVLTELNLILNKAVS